MIEVRIYDLSPPLARPKPDGGVGVYTVVRFPNKEHEDFMVDQWNPKGFPYDDLGRIRQVVEGLRERGLDVVPPNEIKFFTLTPEENAVAAEKFNVIERKIDND